MRRLRLVVAERGSAWGGGEEMVDGCPIEDMVDSMSDRSEWVEEAVECTDPMRFRPFRYILLGDFSRDERSSNVRVRGRACPSLYDGVA